MMHRRETSRVIMLRTSSVASRLHKPCFVMMLSCSKSVCNVERSAFCASNSDCWAVTRLDNASCASF